jgi:hypothetical protein
MLTPTYDYSDFSQINFYIVKPKSKLHWSGDSWKTGYPCCVWPSQLDNCPDLHSPDVEWFTADDVRDGRYAWFEKDIWNFADACAKLRKNN